jgi:hypothetical protein
MAPPPDVLELLLPEADEQQLVRARKVTTFVRLLANDARPAHASTVQVDLERARGELEGEGTRRLRGALVDLLRAYLAAAAGPESFLWCGRADLAPGPAWRVLDEHRDDSPWLADVPGPGETASGVAARLLESLTRFDQGGGAIDELRDLGLELWRARFELARGDVRTAERGAKRVHARAQALAGIVKGTQKGNGARSVRSLAFESLATLAECLLERGAAGAACAALKGAVRPDERVRRLAAWAQLVAGDFAAARRELVGLSPWTGPLPLPLAELRAHRPSWLPCLAGRAPDEVAPRENVSDRWTDGCGGRLRRMDLGATAFVVFAFRSGRGASPVVVDVAPGLRDGTGEWLVDREGAYAVPSAPEHRLIVRARTEVEHASGDVRLAGTLGGASTRAVARVPILAPRTSFGWDASGWDPSGAELRGAELGEVAGWLQLEFEHHLVPSPAKLERLAEGWRSAVLAHLGDVGASDLSPLEADATDMCHGGRLGDARRVDVAMAGHAPSACVFRELVAALGIKTAQRLWWGFELEGDALRLVAHGGGGAGFEDPHRDKGSAARVASFRPLALERARVATGGVVFDEPEPSLSVHPGAASGVVVPLRLPVPERVRRGTVATGFLVIESSRRRDFGQAELEGFARVAESFALVHLCARYGAWSRDRFGVDVRLDATDEGFRERSGHLFAAARSSAPVLVCGPAGAGKRVAARCLHFCGPRSTGPLVALACSLETPSLAGVWERACGGALVLEHVERLGVERQAELAQLLEGTASAGDPGNPRDQGLAPRVVATTRDVLADAVLDGRLRDDLARQLERVQVRVCGLEERRVELPGLAAFLARRIAADENLPEPALSDETLALLWRQPWPGNVRELGAFLHKLVLLHPGEPVGPEHLCALAEHHGIELVRRLPSRRPNRSTILAALRTTRTAGGRSNKTRAALYLGWDPDTLVARMEEAGIAGS